MNRQQRRQQEASAKRKRKFAANPKAMAAYADRARLWAKGAVLTGRHIGDELEGDWTFAPTVPHEKRGDVAMYATHTPLRWHIVAKCICRTPTNDRYTVEAEAECGQAQHISELHDLRKDLMRQCHDQINVLHIWDEIYVMRVLG
jgi:hypothetical protein